MKKTYTFFVPILAVLILLALALSQGLVSRELILKQNGLPLANLRADVLPSVGDSTIIRASTDLNGRLDLSAVPDGTDMVAITLWDDTRSVFNGDIVLPARGSRTIDLRGNQSISTTKTTYAFGLFTLTEREICTRHDPSLP